MLRRSAPALLVLICFILDTTVLPVVYGGIYTVPLTAVAVLLIGILLGRMRGLLYGTIGGLLIDITSGTLGMMMFFFMAIGYLVGLILNNPGEHLPTGRRTVRKMRVKRAVWVFCLYAAGELALFVFQYFNTASIQWRYFANIGVRSLICTALTLLLRPLAYNVLVGNNRGRIPTRDREVKSF
ncbi:MAG: ECF transporter S component [Clostridia bacterium]|nr:ECF transporter S component [Clostridia bacterium]